MIWRGRTSSVLAMRRCLTCRRRTTRP